MLEVRSTEKDIPLQVLPHKHNYNMYFKDHLSIALDFPYLLRLWFVAINYSGVQILSILCWLWKT